MECQYIGGILVYWMSRCFKDEIFAGNLQNLVISVPDHVVEADNINTFKSYLNLAGS